MTDLGRAIVVEWLKRKRSLTGWLVLGSAFFVPSIILGARLWRRTGVAKALAEPRYWELLWVQAWESMALMIAPLAIMLLVSLITQIEDRNKAWKQVHASPLGLATIYSAKLVVILFLSAQMLALFVFGIYVAGALPAVFPSRLGPPLPEFPTGAFAYRTVQFFVDALPVIGLQYLLALRFRSFVAPLAIGMAMWLLAIGMMGSRFNYFVPYSYAGIDYLAVEYKRRIALPFAAQAIAAAWFLVFTVVGYVMYALRGDKG